MIVTEEQAIDIFMYIASTLNCNDVKLSNSYLMAKDIDTCFWFSVFLVNDDGRYHYAFEHDYISLLDRIIQFKYLIIKDEVYKIPNSIEEFFIEMDLNE